MNGREPVKVLFVNDATSNRNWGDRAAATSLRAMIGAVGGEIVHAIGEDELASTALRGRTVHDATASPPGLKERLRPWLPPALLGVRERLLRNAPGPRDHPSIPRRWADFEPLARAALADGGPWPELIEAIHRCDVAIIHGDGCMEGIGIIPRSELFLAYLIKRHLGKPVLIVNHTADFDHPDLREMAKEVYPLFDDVVFRDLVSEERCRSFCNGRFAADTVFSFAPIDRVAWLPVARRPTYFDVWPDLGTFDPAESYLCIGGSSSFGGVHGVAAISEQVAALVRHIAACYAGQIVLTVSDLVDQAVMRPVAAALDLPLIGATTPIQQAVDIVGNADAYIGGRWHPSIFALRGGAPVVALSAKTFKTQALAAAAGLPSDVVDAMRVGDEAEVIGRRLLELLEQGAELRDRLRRWAATEAQRSWGNVDYLKARWDGVPPRVP